METRKTEELKTNGQVRKELGDLTELTRSIKEKGILQPILIDKDNVVIAGHRRLEAAKLAGLKEIPAILTKVDNESRQEIQLIENIHRKDLNPIEEAKAYKAWMKSVGATTEKLAQRIGKTNQYIDRRLRILKASPETSKALQEGKIELGHALLLCQMTSEQQKKAIQDITDYDLTVQNFADQIRWMQKVDFIDIPFRTDYQQKTLLDVDKELNPMCSIESELKEHKAFTKEIAEYVESRRKLLRSKGIKVFNSLEEAKKAHPNMEAIHTYENGYSNAVKSLPGSKENAVIVDFKYGDLDIQVIQLEKKKEPERKEKAKKMTEKEQEDTEKQLELDRKEKLQNRIKLYKRNVLLEGIPKKIESNTKTAKILTLWALLEPQRMGWTLDSWQEEILKEIDCTVDEYGRNEDIIACIATLTESKIDKFILKAITGKMHQIAECDLKKLSELTKFDLSKEWQIDQAYLEMHTKEQLEKLCKEINIVYIDGSKGEVVKGILTAKLKGIVPKAIQKA